MTHEQPPLFDAPEGGAYAAWPLPEKISAKPKRPNWAQKLDHLTATGIVPVRCKACRAWGHASTDCPTPTTEATT